jgi:uncharacterized protein involved in exopolysaccharide biosynthesis
MTHGFWKMLSGKGEQENRQKHDNHSEVTAGNVSDRLAKIATSDLPKHERVAQLKAELGKGTRVNDAEIKAYLGATVNEKLLMEDPAAWLQQLAESERRK